MANLSLDVRELMAVDHSEEILAGLARRDRFSRTTTITSFHYLYVRKDHKGKSIGEASLDDTVNFLKVLSKMTYDNKPVCNFLSDNQIEWNFELTSIVSSLKNPLKPNFRELPPKTEVATIARKTKRSVGRPRKAQRGRPVGSKNKVMKDIKAVQSLRTAVDQSLKSNMIGFFFLPKDSLNDTELAGKVQNFLKSMG